MKNILPLKWWQLVLVTLAVSAVGALSTMQKKQGQRHLYEKELEQAPWAPPGWLFGPAWTFNNFFLLWGLQSIILNKNLPARDRLLVLQAFIWVIYFSFGYVYFNRKSPVLAAFWTATDAVLATVSFLISRKHDKKLSYAYIPLLLWTSFASSVAVYQALHNPDPVFDTPELV